MEYPPEWNDDQTMNVLFMHFRERHVNPASWDRRLKFWSEFIVKYCKSQSKFLITEPDLKSKFARKGKKPLCLPTVLLELHA